MTIAQTQQMLADTKAIKVEEASLSTLATQFKALRDLTTEMEAQVENIKAARDHIAQVLLPEKMDAEGMGTVNVKGIGRIAITQQIRASVKKDDQPLLRQWLRNNGYGELVTETINSSTLKAWVKERIEEAEEYPADIISVHTFEQATLTKA